MLDHALPSSTMYLSFRLSLLLCLQTTHSSFSHFLAPSLPTHLSLSFLPPLSRSIFLSATHTRTFIMCKYAYACMHTLCTQFVPKFCLSPSLPLLGVRTKRRRRRRKESRSSRAISVKFAPTLSEPLLSKECLLFTFIILFSFGLCPRAISVKFALT
jgi:hypothetical protein